MFFGSRTKRTAQGKFSRKVADVRVDLRKEWVPVQRDSEDRGLSRHMAHRSEEGILFLASKES